MELYILDNDYRRTKVVDRFESLVWTERFQAYGDFELTLYSTADARNLFKYGTKVTTNKSTRVMVVDEIEDTTDADGKKVISIKGNSIEKTLDDRIASYSLTNLTSIVKGPALIGNDDLITYTDHQLLTGDFVYFKTTGELPSYVKGTIKAISITDNTFKIDNHGFYNGDKIYFSTTGTLPTNVVAGTIYYVIVVNSSLFKLATTLANSDNEVPIDITGTPSGTHTVYSKLLANTGYSVIKVSDNTFKIAHTAEDAQVGTFINIEGTQSGVHTLYWYNFGKWRVSGLPADIIRLIFKTFCIDGFLDITDKIPKIQLGDIYPENTIGEPSGSITMDIKITTVYDIIKQLSEIYALGFRIVRNYENGGLLFNVYSGDKKTSSQNDFNPVVFDASIDTLLSETEYSSVKNLKNVAYVFAPNGYRTVYSSDATTGTSGLEKRILYVDASDITLSAGPSLDNQLEIRGKQELSKNRMLFAFDGEVPSFNGYIYDVDYSLGDIVEVRNSDGYANEKRVTEQIFSDDIQGEKSYPTLSSELVITPGTWSAWDSEQDWDQVSDTLHWSDL